LNKTKTWTLEVVDHQGTSHCWDDQFTSDKEARNTAIQAIEAEGAIAFMRGDNVIPFRKTWATQGQYSND
jgi:long-subunit fatty acid transport protein